MTNTLFSSVVEVKRSKVVVEINGKPQMLLKGDTINLGTSDEICLTKGKGKLVINNQIQITKNSRNKCFKKIIDTLSQSKSLTTSAEEYLDSSEEVVAGMSRKIKISNQDR